MLNRQLQYDWLIDWLIFIRARNKRTCNEQNNSDNKPDTKIINAVSPYRTDKQSDIDH